MTRKYRPLIACLLLGCQSSGETAATDSAAAGEGPAGTLEPSGSGAGPAGDGDARSTSLAGAAVPRGLAHEGELTEVWLDPRAGAALTLDANGGVRLWPTLPTATDQPGVEQDLAALAPIRVPLREPASLSLARAGERSFVIASIDTMQMGRVQAIELDEAGAARVIERFTIPIHDPLLELHVFDGGDRILALGVDHRLTLYDGHGEVVSQLVEYGLAPWQLRVAGPPEAPQLAMVLVGPTRLQRLSIAGDRLEAVGEARPFTLDRGPNLNDLALLPSGSKFAVFRRPKARGPQWSLELHDFATGEVRVLWGEVEGKHRPRLHLVDDDRALLEDGTGAGFWVYLRGGVVMPAPFELPEELDKLPPESRVEARRVTLPESTLANRRRASVVAGLRAVASAGQLILDPVDQDHYHRLTTASRHAHNVTLDRDGSHLAFSHDAKLFVDELGTGETHPVACPAPGIWSLAFTDDEHLLVVERDKLQICAWQTGQVVSELAFEEELAYDAIHLGEPGAGQLAIKLDYFDDEDPAKLLALSFTQNRLGSFARVDKAGLAAWPELDDDRKTLAVDGQGRRYRSAKVDTREFAIDSGDGEPRTVRFADDDRNIERLLPSPDGRSVALIHHREVNHRYYEYYYDTSPNTLDMWSIAAETPELLWSIPQPLASLSWSGDGSRLAIASNGGAGYRVLTPSGELVAETRGGTLTHEQLPDLPSPAGESP